MDSVCLEKAKMLEDYETAASEFSRTVSVLKAGIGMESRADDEEMRAATERTRLHCEHARMLLDAHTAEHGC